MFRRIRPPSPVSSHRRAFPPSSPCWLETRRVLSTSSDSDNKVPPVTSTPDLWSKDRVTAAVSHSFPDFIEFWDRNSFRKVGYGLIAGTSALGTTTVFLYDPAAVSTFLPASTLLSTLLTAIYWRVGLQDIQQRSHAVRRNYPVLGNMRYILETLRPELRQYIVESDSDGAPFDRNRRALVYQRAKSVTDTIPFGTRRNVYATHHEWACHSLYPTQITSPEAKRVWVGTADFGTTQPYSASALNVSAMSYGAISANAILALSRGAQLGGFYHNTGEGGVSRYHAEGGGDLVWNVGTGYFGACIYVVGQT